MIENQEFELSVLADWLKVEPPVLAEYWTRIMGRNQVFLPSDLVRQGDVAKWMTSSALRRPMLGDLILGLIDGRIEGSYEDAIWACVLDACRERVVELNSSGK